ncbi:MAG: hypothetical protein A4E65_01515 [Syntrophorhabdus sp. PtaU1.Bin153]|nr:MAG: hypothetical protein A4E65_01515 [Syntrophorhabdus sp. PtaU1.Bin153]
MKGVKVLLMAILLAPLLAYGAGSGDVNLRFIQGDVQIKTEDTQDWVPAAINVPLFEKDMLWVPEDGKAELQLAEGSVVRLDGGTLMEVVSLDKKGFECYLGEGHAYVNIRGSKGYPVEVSTPGGPFRGYSPSVFRIDVNRDGDVQASTLTGALYTEDGNGEMKIDAGERLVFNRNQGEPELMRVPSSDSWERWNRDRDRELFGSVYGSKSSRYLPEELIPYSNDFDENGRWVQTSEYGYVWTPTVIVEDDWAPYRLGRWIWVRGDYVWLSYERWGWAPHHYGRWAHIRHLGWCWVPPRRGYTYWSPGYVAWVHTPRHVAWTPLAPRETYYGRGYFGPNSVNITNVNINKTVINNINVYKNIHVRNAVTTLDRDSFIYGKQNKVPMTDNLFLKEKKVMPAPVIQPVKATAMPVIRNVPPAKLPPQKVRNVKAGDLDKPYPVYRNPIKSDSRTKPVSWDTPPKKVPGPSRPGEPGKNRLDDKKPQAKSGNSPAKDGKIIRDLRSPDIRVPSTPAAGQDNRKPPREKDNKPVILVPAANKSPGSIAPPGKETTPPNLILQRNDRGQGRQIPPSGTFARPQAQPAQPKALQPAARASNPQPNPQGAGVVQPRRETKPVTQTRSIPASPPEARPTVRNTPASPTPSAPPVVQQRNDRGQGRQIPPSGTFARPQAQPAQPKALQPAAVTPNPQGATVGQLKRETKPVTVTKGSQPVSPNPAANIGQQQDGGNRRVLETPPMSGQSGPGAAQGRFRGSAATGR